MKDYMSRGNQPGSRSTICTQRLSNLIHLLHRRVQEQGEKTLYTYLKDGESQETRLTYCELERRALAIAAQLQSHLSSGDRILLLYPPGVEFPAAFFGCLCAGMVAVPTYPPHSNQFLASLVETVSDATTAELNQAFDRLNRNVSRLNSQELRHAKFGGQFITKMEKLADDDFWEEVGLITPSRRRRMLDVEYVSEFYAICLMGVQDGKDYLDLIYADFDDEIPEEKAADQLFRRIRKQLEEMNKIRQLSLTRFKNVADFYSLWAALHSAFSDNTGVLPSAAASEALVAFQEELEAQDTKRSVSYLLAARQGSNKAPNRQLRADILKKILTSQGGE